MDLIRRETEEAQIQRNNGGEFKAKATQRKRKENFIRDRPFMQKEREGEEMEDNTQKDGKRMSKLT